MCEPESQRQQVDKGDHSCPEPRFRDADSGSGEGSVDQSRKLGLPPPATAGVAGQHGLLPGGSGTVPAPSFSPAPQMSSLLSKGLKRNTEKRRCGEEGGPG